MAAGKNLTTIAATILLLHGTPAPAQTSWTTFGFDHERTGYNPGETTLSPGNVGELTAKWNVDLGGTITAQPVLAGNLVYAATGLGKVYALDASTGTAVWSVQLGTTSVDCGDFDQNTVGVIGAPTIDRRTTGSLWCQAMICCTPSTLAPVTSRRITRCS